MATSSFSGAVAGTSRRCRAGYCLFSKRLITPLRAAAGIEGPTVELSEARLSMLLGRHRPGASGDRRETEGASPLR